MASRGNYIWIECEICKVFVPQNDYELHNLNNCPPTGDIWSPSFIKNNIFHGKLDTVGQKSISGVSSKDINKLAFLSHSFGFLCKIALHDDVVISVPEVFGISPVVRKAWYTTENSVSTIMVTENDMRLNWGKLEHRYVKVSKLENEPEDANEIVLGCDNLRNVEIDKELIQRIQHAYKNSILTFNNKLSIFYYGKHLTFFVKHLKLKNETNLELAFNKLHIKQDLHLFCKLTDKTKITIHEKVHLEKSVLKLTDIGGLDKEISEIQEIMSIALEKRFSEKDMSVLLYGYSGTGKTSLQNAIANGNGANIFEIKDLDLNEPEEKIKLIFSEVINNTPSILLLDKIDLICPQRNSRASEKEKRVAKLVIDFLEHIHEQVDNRIFILATTNKLDSLDLDLRSSIDQEIEIPVPNPKNRFEILTKFLSKTANDLSRDDVLEITNAAHGYVGRDLKRLCARAQRKCFSEKKQSITLDHFKISMKQIKPSAMREAQVIVPDVKWSDIGGQHKLKTKLKQIVEWPLKYQTSFARLGIKPPRSVLMYGPPGCSKTMIAKALATESKLNFLSIKGSELFNKYVGESEKAVRDLFKKARQVAPAIVFFDEIDALGGERSLTGSGNTVQERVLTQLLTELDGITPLENVIIVGATNRPDRMDRALLRPGRFDRIMYVPLPDPDTREEIFKLHLPKKSHENIDIELLVQMTEGYSGAEINALCNEAAMIALSDDIEVECVEMEHFRIAINSIKPNTSKSLLNMYAEYSEGSKINV